MSFTLIMELIVLLGAIAIGSRAGGIAMGLWGGVGLAILVFGFGATPGASRRSAADHPRSHHGRVGDGSGGRNRFPRAHRRGDKHTIPSSATVFLKETSPESNT